MVPSITSITPIFLYSSSSKPPLYWKKKHCSSLIEMNRRKTYIKLHHFHVMMHKEHTAGKKENWPGPAPKPGERQSSQVDHQMSSQVDHQSVDHQWITSQSSQVDHQWITGGSPVQSAGSPVSGSPVDHQSVQSGGSPVNGSPVDHQSVQSGGSPKVAALFSATNLSTNIIELLQLHDTIRIKWNYA